MQNDQEFETPYIQTKINLANYNYAEVLQHEFKSAYSWNLTILTPWNVFSTMILNTALPLDCESQMHYLTL